VRRGSAGGGGGPGADKGAADAGEVSDPCCLAAPAAGGAPPVAALAAMAVRERGPVGAEGWCRCCEEAATTSVIFLPRGEQATGDRRGGQTDGVAKSSQAELEPDSEAELMPKPEPKPGLESLLLRVAWRRLSLDGAPICASLRVSAYTDDEGAESVKGKRRLGRREGGKRWPVPPAPQ
jgi:hypothetical protein